MSVSCIKGYVWMTLPRVSFSLFTCYYYLRFYLVYIAFSVLYFLCIVCVVCVCLYAAFCRNKE